VNGISAKRRARRTAAAIAAGAVVFASLPTAGFALGALEGGSGSAALAAFTPASADPALARLVAGRGEGISGLIRFTPAGATRRPDRSVTVAVRIDEDEARAISVRSAIEAAREQVAADAGLRLAPTRYNLGIARGYQSFAKPAPALSRTLSDARIPDLADFRPTAGGREDPSRFAARIEVEEKGKVETAPAVRDGQTLDLAGSYRLTRNLDVTAGVRYSQELDRLAPLPDSAKQDNQAVYVGTQFKF
jgi:hypothetical protein